VVEQAEIFSGINICKQVGSVKVKFGAYFHKPCPGFPNNMLQAVIIIPDMPFKQGYNPVAVNAAQWFQAISVMDGNYQISSTAIAQHQLK
jgi:hypothetical protein